jgi:hypothetical protein
MERIKKSSLSPAIGKKQVMRKKIQKRILKANKKKTIVCQTPFNERYTFINIQ